MPKLLSVADAAERLGVSRRRVRQLIERGELDGSRVGRTWLVDPRSVERRCSQTPAAGRPLDRRRAWSTALVADRLVEELAGKVAGRAVDELLHHERAALAERLNRSFGSLCGLDAGHVAADERRRTEVEQAMGQSLAALDRYNRRERLVESRAAMLSAMDPPLARSVGITEQLAALGQGPEEEKAAIRRLQRKLGHGGDVTAGHLAPFRSRSGETKGFYGHPSAIPALAADRRLVLSGAHGAHRHGADIVAGDELDAYAQASLLGELADAYGLEPVARSDANVWIRPVPELPPNLVVAPRLFVAADLLDHDPRSRAAAIDLLELVVTAIRWFEE